MSESVTVCDEWCRIEPCQEVRLKPLIPALTGFESVNTLVSVKSATEKPQNMSEWKEIRVENVAPIVMLKGAAIGQRQCNAVVANKTGRIFLIAINLFFDN